MPNTPVNNLHSSAWAFEDKAPEAGSATAVNNSKQPPFSIPDQAFALLRWQLLFAAGLLGLFIPRAPVAASLAAPLFFLLALPRLRGAYGVTLALGCCALGLLVGLMFGAAGPAPSPAPLPGWMAAGKKVQVQARVLRTESTTDQRLRVILEDVVCDPAGEAPRPLPAKLVLTWIKPPLRPLPGDTLRTRLRIRPVRNFANAGTWDIEDYWAKQGVRYRAYLFKEKERVLVLPQQQSPWQALRKRIMGAALESMGGGARMTQGKAVLFALLFGERYYLSPDTARLLQHASLAHSLALSGLHVGFALYLGFLLGRLLCRLFPRLTLRVPRGKICTALGLACAAPYVWLGNATPSLLRAFLMFTVWAVLLWRGSPRVLLDGLWIAVLLLVLLDPQMAFDLRLQLSASAVAGIACFLELRRTLLVRIKARTAAARANARPRLRGLALRTLTWMADLLGVSLAAQLATLPLVIGYFGEIPLNPLPNLLWLPLLFAALAGGLLALLLAGLGAAYAGGLLMSLAALPLDSGLNFLAQLHAWDLLPTLLCLRPGEAAWPGYWGVLLCGVLATRQLLLSGPCPGRRNFLRPACLYGALLLFGPALAGLARPHPELSLTMLDVGQGQALLLETPGGKRLLLDGGGFKSRTFDVGQSIVAPVLTRNRAPALDWVAYSHPDNDHLRGLLYVLSHFRVGAFATNGCLPQDWNQIPLALLLRQRRITPAIWARGQTIELEPKLKLEVLHPPLGLGCGDSNNASLCLRLVWQGRGLALLPGDLEQTGLRQLLRSGQNLAAQILVLPHHGAAGGLCPELYVRTAPVAALCSAGYLNQFHFPAKSVATALAAQGIPLHTTAEQGAIRVRWPAPAAPPALDSVRRPGGKASGGFTCSW